MNGKRKIGILLMSALILPVVGMAMAIAAPDSIVTNKVIIGIEGMT